MVRHGVVTASIKPGGRVLVALGYVSSLLSQIMYRCSLCGNLLDTALAWLPVISPVNINTSIQCCFNAGPPRSRWTSIEATSDQLLLLVGCCSCAWPRASYPLIISLISICGTGLGFFTKRLQGPG